MARKRPKKYVVFLNIGKHAEHRLQEMSNALGLRPKALVSFALTQMIRKLERQPQILPWISKLFLEVGEPLVNLAQAELSYYYYFRFVKLSLNRRLTISDLATRLIAVVVPFWDYHNAVGLTGKAQKEELGRGIQIDLALGFAKL